MYAFGHQQPSLRLSKSTSLSLASDISRHKGFIRAPLNPDPTRRLGPQLNGLREKYEPSVLVQRDQHFIDPVARRRTWGPKDDHNKTVTTIPVAAITGRSHSTTRTGRTRVDGDPKGDYKVNNVIAVSDIYSGG
jgi:hypothetical protein